MIKYDKLIAIMNEKNITSYTCRQHGIIGQASYKKIMTGGNIDMRTLDNLCRYLHCQPGELIEYVNDSTNGSDDNITNNGDTNTELQFDAGERFSLPWETEDEPEAPSPTWVEVLAKHKSPGAETDSQEGFGKTLFE